MNVSDSERAVVLGAALFSGLDEHVAAALAGAFRTVRVRAGGKVFEEGDLGDALYIVLDGRVVLQTSDRGQDQILALLDRGDMFGELSLFDPGPRTATALAWSDSRLATVGRDTVLAWAAEFPEVAARLLQVLARRLRRTNSTLRDLVFVDVAGRVARVLLELADRYGRTEDRGIVVAHRLTQTQVAQMVGSSRETVNKALSDFAHRGWIDPSPRQVTILDAAALRRRARVDAKPPAIPAPRVTA